MQKNKVLGAALIGLALLGGGLWYKQLRNHPNKTPNGEPQKTAEEILAERARQAASHLNSPLGKAVLNKDWQGIQKLYQPRTQFVEMAEIVRALFIEGKMRDFSLPEQDQLLALLLDSLSSLEEKNLHLASLLITQVERMPSPQHDSLSYKTLKTWLSDASAQGLKKRIAILKLALQDLKPDTNALQIFRQGLVQGSTFGVTRSDWIQQLDDTRNEIEHTKSAEFLLKNYQRISKDAQPAALVVLSHQLKVGASEIHDLALQSFESEEIGSFEASLRAIGNLAEAKMIKSPEKEAIVKKLTHIPLALQSPFAKAKAVELLNILSRE